MTQETLLFDRVVIIGLGLIGSSLARRLRRDNLAGEVVGCDLDEETRILAEAMEVTDRAVADASEAAAGADLAVIAVPLSAFPAIAAAIAPQLAAGAIVTDVGSVKMSVFDSLSQEMPAGVHVIPGHPIAGTEHSGVEAGFAELFDERYCLLTPPEDADESAVARLVTLWEACGAIVQRMGMAHHDQVLAITSHLPHLIAFTIVGTAADLEDDLEHEVIKYSAGGFRDFTRIASSDPTMWRDIFLDNRDAVLDILQRFNEDLTALQRAIRRGDGDALQKMFARTREIRRGVIEYRQAD